MKIAKKPGLKLGTFWTRSRNANH